LLFALDLVEEVDVSMPAKGTFDELLGAGKSLCCPHQRVRRLYGDEPMFWLCSSGVLFRCAVLLVSLSGIGPLFEVQMGALRYGLGAAKLGALEPVTEALVGLPGSPYRNCDCWVFGLEFFLGSRTGSG
jgi:hypothetical protein